MLPNLSFVVRTERADIGQLSAVDEISKDFNQWLCFFTAYLKWGMGEKQSVSYSQYAGGYFLRSYLDTFLVQNFKSKNYPKIKYSTE